MGKDYPWAWLNQAGADYAASTRAYDPEDFSTACHAVAKHQQAVEKSVKAIVAALHDKGVIVRVPGFNHDVGDHVSALIRLPHNPVYKNIQNKIHGLLGQSERSEIKELGLLAPKRPGPGKLASRNTEYPYQRPDGTWRAPAADEPGGFDDQDVLRFRQIAQRVYEGTARLLSALYRV